MSIRELPSAVRSALRSGVVIPTPTQAVVELVLNSLDAGASAIAIRLDLRIFKLQVIDNGHGINLSDLEAIGSMSLTSKCYTIEDLYYNLKYHGFRGEALASLAEMSGILEIITRPKGMEKTFCKVFTHGKAEVKVNDERRPACGTTVTITDFMFNMPVRRGAMQETIELETIRTHVAYIALIHPKVSFSIRNDSKSRMLLEKHKSSSILNAFSQLFGETISQSFAPIEYKSEKFVIHGFVSKIAHRHNDMQFIYINRQIILKTKLHHVVRTLLAKSSILRSNGPWRHKPIPKDVPVERWMSFPSLEKRNKYPAFVINIECARKEYDVCWDSKKTLVYFGDWEDIVSCINEAIQIFLRRENLVEDEPSDIGTEDARNCFSDAVKEKTQHESDSLKRIENPIQGNQDSPYEMETWNINGAVHSRAAKRPKLINELKQQPLYETPKHDKVHDINICQNPHDMTLVYMTPRCVSKEPSDTNAPSNCKVVSVAPVVKFLGKYEPPPETRLMITKGAYILKRIEDDSKRQEKGPSSLQKFKCSHKPKLSGVQKSKPLSRNSVSDAEEEEVNSKRNYDLEESISSENHVVMKEDSTSGHASNSSSDTDMISEICFDKCKIKEKSTQTRKVSIEETDSPILNAEHNKQISQKIVSRREQPDKRVRFFDNFQSSKNTNKIMFETNEPVSLMHCNEMNKNQSSELNFNVNDTESSAGETNVNNRMNFNKTFNQNERPQESQDFHIDIFNDRAGVQPSPMRNNGNHVRFDFGKHSDHNGVHYGVPESQDDFLDNLINGTDSQRCNKNNVLSLFQKTSPDSSLANEERDLLSLLEGDKGSTKFNEKHPIQIIRPPLSVLFSSNPSSDSVRNEGNIVNEDFDTSFQSLSDNLVTVPPRNDINTSHSVYKRNEKTDLKFRDDFRTSQGDFKKGALKDQKTLGFSGISIVSVSPPMHGGESCPTEFDKKSVEDAGNFKTCNLRNFSYKHFKAKTNVDKCVNSALPSSIFGTNVQLPYFSSQCNVENAASGRSRIVQKDQEKLSFTVVSNIELPDTAESECTTSTKCLDTVKSHIGTSFQKDYKKFSFLNAANSETPETRSPYFSQKIPETTHQPANLNNLKAGLSFENNTFVMRTPAVNKFVMKNNEMNICVPFEKFCAATVANKGNCSPYFESKNNNFCPNEEEKLKASFEFQKSTAPCIKNLNENKINNFGGDALSKLNRPSCLMDIDISVMSQKYRFSSPEENVNFNESIETKLSSIELNNSYEFHEMGTQDSASPGISSLLQAISFSPLSDCGIQSCSVSAEKPEPKRRKLSDVSIPNKENEIKLCTSPDTCEVPRECVENPKSVQIYSNSIITHQKLCPVVQEKEKFCNGKINHHSDNANRWVLSCNSDGKPYFYNRETGFTTYSGPCEEHTFSMTKRSNFIPKGMSPILCAVSRRDVNPPVPTLWLGVLEGLSRDMAKSKDELSSVKWRNTADMFNICESDVGSVLNIVKTIESKATSTCMEIPDVSFFSAKMSSLLFQQKFDKQIFSSLKVIGQLDNKFIITLYSPVKDSHPYILGMFDQHAVHERIRLEHLMKKYSEDEDEWCFKTCDLPEPLILTVNSKEYHILGSFEKKFQRLGLHFVLKDENTIEMLKIPTCLQTRDARERANKNDQWLKNNLLVVIQDQVQFIMKTRGQDSIIPEIYREVINSEACKGAIKFGDPLTISQCTDLLSLLSTCNLPFFCAHGRPSFMPIFDMKLFEIEIQKYSQEK